MNYKLSKKNEQGKWWTWGYVKENQYKNLQASFKVTPELKALFNNVPDGQYINFSMFEDEGKKQGQQAPIRDDAEDAPW